MSACLTNRRHLEPGAAYGSRVGDIALPTLVVHGTDDPLLPFEHAVALADEIPTAQLLPLRAVGHQMPPPGTWDTLVPALLSHTEAHES
ncbi:alpha/beta hydrolase [Actinoallomurus sp. NPDC050550]|uniref:alpha/beta fold hydrolase n=1 Tax=Actinoallomurus sp. NPDC050550 TaxID=3154937 RepID=UPI003408AEFD